MDIIATSESTWQESAGSVVVADYNDGFHDGVEEGQKNVVKPYVDSSKITDLAYFCYEGKRLDVLFDPNFDTSQVTNFINLFAYTKGDILFTYPLSSLDTSSATNMGGMFMRMEATNIAFYALDWSHFIIDMRNVTNTDNMFSASSAFGKLPTFKNMQKVENIYRFAYQSTYISEVNLPETSACTNFQAAFDGCRKLHTITLNVNSGTEFKNAFSGCTALVNFTPIGTFKASVDFKSCTQMTAESWVRIFNALADLTGQTACTLTIPTGLDETIIPSELRILAKSRNWNVMEA